MTKKRKENLSKQLPCVDAITFVGFCIFDDWAEELVEIDLFGMYLACLFWSFVWLVTIVASSESDESSITSKAVQSECDG